MKPYMTVEEAASRYRKNSELPGKKVIPKKIATFKPDFSKDNLPQHQERDYGQCPSGQRMYRTKSHFGIGARNIGCMTAYEAESLRRQNVSNFQNNLNRNRTRNCTSNLIGSTTYTNCY